MAVWPVTLPAPQLPGYAVSPQGAFIRTQMESGPARQRRRSTAVPKNITVSWRFTAAQMDTFKNFFEVDINHGTDWFSMSVDVGAGMATHDCRFTNQNEPYKSSALPGMNWEVSAPIEVRNA